MFATPRARAQGSPDLPSPPPPLSASQQISSSASQLTQLALDLSLPESPRRSPPAKPSWGSLYPSSKTASVLATRAEPILLRQSVFGIGRNAHSQLAIPDIMVSSKHCSLVLDEAKGTVCLVDHRSSNGTFVNEVRLEPEAPYYLVHGDVVSLVNSCRAMAAPAIAITSDNKRAKMERPAFSFTFHQHPAPITVCVDARAKAPLEFTQKFGLISELGRGNFATVFKAINRTTGELVAVKVIEKSKHLHLSSGRFKAQVQEAEVLSTIHHPYIVSYRGLVQTEESLYVVTELLRGGELFERLVSFGAYPEPRAKLLVRRLCQALAYLHDRGVVHRDVKPENIVLKGEEDDVECKLVDFGVATTLQGNARSKTFCGSLSYIAPEVLKRRTSLNKQGSYGKEVDIWSLGVTVHVILSLRPPFDEEENSQMHAGIDFVLRFDSAEWDSVSRQAKNFVARCLEVDLAKRMTAKQCLEHEWLR